MNKPVWDRVFYQHNPPLDTWANQSGDTTMKADRVNKPEHYNHNETGIECIDAIKAATGEHFDDIEDIQKAQVYIGWLEDYRTEQQDKA